MTPSPRAVAGLLARLARLVRRLSYRPAPLTPETLRRETLRTMTRVQLAREIARQIRMGDAETTAFVAFISAKTTYMNKILTKFGSPMAAERELLTMLVLAWMGGESYALRKASTISKGTQAADGGA